MFRSKKTVISNKFLVLNPIVSILSVRAESRTNNSLIFIIILFSSFFYSCQNNSNNITSIAINANPTFVEIAPIIFKNCTPCHRKGESGPFELTTYDEVKKNANKIKFVTQTKYMPPWPADKHYTTFIGERTLSDEEIELIKVWAENGAPLGDESKVPSVPVFYQGSFLGKPDTVIKYIEPIPIKGNGTDHFYIIKLPLKLGRDTFVKYFEFVPHQRKLAHHINGHLINYEKEQKEDLKKGLSYSLDNFKDYRDLYFQMNILNDNGTFPVLTPNTVYYLPGFTPPVYPDGIGGYKINQTSAVLLKNIHYGPSSKDVEDTSYINVFYGRKPERPVFETQLGTFGVSEIEPELILQPNQIQTFHTKAKVDKPISILSVNPHMHLLGKSFLAYAIKANGDTIRLIKINKWDFKWQYYYTYPQPVIIPQGSTIHVFGTFDNTDKNPFNPNHPPKVVTQGEGVRSMQTTEEMFQFIFTYLQYKPGDENMDLSK